MSVIEQEIKMIKEDAFGQHEAIKPDTQSKEDSLEKRYGYKLLTNLVGLAIATVTQAIIPRGLGPKAYGDFSFLSNTFMQIAKFLNMGTSIGFYIKLSKRQNDFGLVAFYLSFIGLESLLLFMFVGCAHLTATYTLLWPDQELFYIYLAAVWAVVTLIAQILNKMADAYGVTVSTEVARIFQKAFGLVLILALFVMNQLTLTHFFFYHYCILVLLALMFIFIMDRKGYTLKQNWKLSWAQIQHYTREFYHYSHPLFVYALVVLIAIVLDRWMLQRFSGSVQQGFYGLSYQIGAVCFLFSSAMTPLITREFSIAFAKNDLIEMARLFRRYIPMLYAIAAYFACFVAVEAEKVTFIMGGKKFQQAALAVAIMSFYPIHQTYGQLSGAVFYATGQTKLYRNIGIIFALLGLPVTYFLIAPGDKMGLNAGATGLAIKMVAIQFIGVNVQLYFNARLLKLRFWRYVGHQVVSVGCLLGLAMIAMVSVDRGLALHDRVLSCFLLAGILYTLMVMALIYLKPVLFGVTRQDIHSLVQLGIKKCGKLLSR